MKEYLDCLKFVYENGTDKGDRTGTGTRSHFGYQMRFDLKKGFPAVTTKKLFFKGVVHELLWLLSGDTNIKYLEENGVKIWNEWATEEGELGPVYGSQWRSWENTDGTTIDQIKDVVEGLKINPDSRRHIVTAWNPSVLPNSKLSPRDNAENGNQALPPCHAFFQFYSVERDNGRRELSCQLYQRSADLFLGVPFNIASYSLLTHMMAHVTDHDVGDFVHTIGDAHIYSNHFDQVITQLSRTPMKLPTIKLNSDIKSIDGFKFEDIELVGYNSHPSIKGAISV